MAGQRRTPPPDAAARALVALVALAALALALAAAAAPAPPPPPPPPPLSPEVRRLVVDADAGADDAAALMMALGSERLGRAPRTEAVTCVNGNTNLSNVVFNVFRVLDACGRLDVPVYAGAEQSLVTTPPSDNFFGLDGFGDIGGNRSQYAGLLQKEHAVNFLIRTVAESPGEVTLLCLGPLTNVALAERLHRGFVSKLRHLIVLGGSVEGRGNVRPGVEFNAHVDPEALHVALQAAGAARRPLLLVPWETVALRVRLSLGWRKHVLGALNSSAVRLLNRAEHRFLERAGAAPPDAEEEEGVEEGEGAEEGEEGAEEGVWPAADAVAAGVALHGALAERVSRPLHVAVALGPGPARATLQVDYARAAARAPNARLVLRVRAAALRRLLLEWLA